MSARSRRRESGFTLIELVAVLAILAILAAYAAPRLIDDTSSFSERGYADELASTLRLARSVAVATSCDVQVSINAGAYQVLQRAAAGGAAAPCAGAFVTPVRRADGNTLSGQPPSGVNIPGNVAFTFSALTGSVAGGAPPALAVGTFTISLDADGWTQVR
jgi:type II secretion system protein H